VRKVTTNKVAIERMRRPPGGVSLSAFPTLVLKGFSY
jgi:hypothetical protein